MEHSIHNGAWHSPVSADLRWDLVVRPGASDQTSITHDVVVMPLRSAVVDLRYSVTSSSTNITGA